MSGSSAKVTRRQLETLRGGFHPLTHVNGVRYLRLHAEAPPVDDRTAEGPRCGNCSHLQTDQRYPKCDLYWSNAPQSDCRRWWPGCTSHKPREDDRG
jgi:hypothetical protein